MLNPVKFPIGGNNILNILNINIFVFDQYVYIKQFTEIWSSQI